MTYYYVAMPSKKYTSVESILKDLGPSSSSAIQKQFIHEGLSPETARKRVSRAGNRVKRLTGLRFPHNEKFLYLEDTLASLEFWESLNRYLDTSKSVYRFAIQGLMIRNGIIPEKHFEIVSGCPIKQKKQLTANTVLNDLEKVGLIERILVDGIGSCVAINSVLVRPDIPGMKARLITENVLLLAIKEWCRKIGLISYDKVTTRGTESELTRVGTCSWDLCGPSYVKTLAEKGRDGERSKPGFVVCDVYMNNEPLTEQGLGYFLHKYRLIEQFPNMSPVLPIFVANYYDSEAFKRGKAEGLLLATPNTLFGDEVAEALRSLLETLTKAAAMAAANPDKIYDLFSSLSRIEGAAGNLRGALFEMIVGHCVKEKEGNTIDIGRIVTDPDNGKRSEIDVLRVKEHMEVWCYECKAHQPTELVSLAQVQEWLSKKVPTQYNALKSESRFSGSKFGFEYWTCGDFTPEASVYLEDNKAKTKKYSLGWKNKDGVYKYAQLINSKSIMDTLKQHYFQHPLAKASASVATPTS